MTSCVAGLQYLPSVEYFVHWLHHRVFIIEKNEYYQKRTWRNKTAILGSQQPLILSVPLRKGKNQQMLITDVEIAYDEYWPRIHLTSIQAAYGKTAFWGEIEKDVETIYKTNPRYLWELNIQFIQFIISFFPGEWNIEYTENYQENLPDDYLDLRNGVPAGQTSLDIYEIPVYEQIHRLSNSHLPNLSILDVLCHLGPGTYEYLKRYAAELYR